MADGKAGNAESDARRDLDADALFERATERPGVREVMRVYEDWKRVDRGLESYRAAVKWVRHTTGWHYT